MDSENQIHTLDDEGVYCAMREMKKRYNELRSRPEYREGMDALESFFCYESSGTGK